MDEQNVSSEVIETARAIEALAATEDRFRATFDAFRAQDAESFQRLLDEAKVLPRCEWVCHWLCSKECVLVCLDLCGPPPEELPDLDRFAEVVGRITADEELVERLASAIEDRDRDAFQKLVADLEIEPFCHLLCHWACGIRCRLVCTVVCPPPPPRRPHFVEELARAGRAVQAFALNKKALAVATEAARLGQCDPLRAAIVEFGLVGQCEWICEWICSWRCVRLCVDLCRPFSGAELDTSLTEAFAFAQVTARLATQPAIVGRLVKAVGAADGAAFEGAVKELKLERYCIQLCHWLCYLDCRRFCECVCPSPEVVPHWQQVEVFDIHPPEGNVGAHFSVEGFAGDPTSEAYVFGGGVRLRGNCPLTNIATGNPLEYRFVIGEWTWMPPGDNPATVPSVAPAALAPVTNVDSTLVGYVFYPDGNGQAQSAEVRIDSTDAANQGWIKVDGKPVTVPMYNPPNSTAVVNVSPSNFLRTFDLMVLDSPAITGTHAPKMPLGLPKSDAGRSLTALEEEPIRRYRLDFEVRDSVTMAVVATDSLNAIILDNSPVIRALDLEELRSNACNPLAGQQHAHILYSVDHPHLRRFSIDIANNNGVVHPPPAFSGSPTVAMPEGHFTAGGFFFRGGAGGPHVVNGTGGVAVDIAGDPSCAYIVTLSWLTRRYQDLGQQATILYCK